MSLTQAFVESLNLNCLHSQCIFHLCAPAAAGTCQGGVVGGGWQKGVVGGVGPQSTLLSPIQLLYTTDKDKVNKDKVEFLVPSRGPF